MQENYAPQYPAEVSFQMMFRVPIPAWRVPPWRWAGVWLPVTRRYFRRRVAALVDPLTNLDDVLIGMAHTNGAWVLFGGRNAFRIRSF